MNKRQGINIEGAFEAEALRILREVPGLTVSSQPPGLPPPLDAVVGFAGNRHPIAVEFKRQLNAATAWQVAHQAESQPDVRMLLVCGQSTTQARDILTQHGVSVIDGLGNVHLELPGLLIHLQGRRRQPRRSASESSPARLRGKAGVIAQALLHSPGREWNVAGLAAEARVSTALAHRVLVRLEREGVVIPEGAGPNRVRRITNPTALLDLWAEEHIDRPQRTLAYLLAQTSQQVVEKLGRRLDDNGIDYALTGAAAGSLVAPFITAVPVVDVWVQATASLEELYRATGATPVDEGQNVVLLQSKDDAPLSFRERVNGLWMVNRFRLYADLRRDPRRGREQAEHLRQEVIGF